MLAECPLIGFIPTTDSERARKFYVDQLKLEFVADDQFALVVKTQTSMVRMRRRRTSRQLNTPSSLGSACHCGDGEGTDGEWHLVYALLLY